MNEYLMKTPRTLGEFKAFLTRLLPKGDFIVKEYKGFPYRILTSSKYNNLFKYTIVPKKNNMCNLLIKDLLAKDQIELKVHIKNLTEAKSRYAIELWEKEI
ncbi:hypothetical protein LCGC14_1239030 [marine sediment metagenome]|uniref:Uncharacterized protein n=1 Tax=marine sediment metagenome TaxID=412755 RepID=A0A0F9L6K8_9ZZZZ